MHKTEIYISELLHAHDCVIVPNLGGFLASIQSSHVSPISQSIYPPHRKLAFNIYLRQNDGLLANHLVSFENISYDEAMQRIDRFVTSCLEKLDQGRKVVLHNIGSLYYDAEKNIQFEADRSVNYLIDSFGLQPVHFSPVQKDTTSTSPVSASRSSFSNKTAKINSKKIRNIVGAIGITAAIVWFSFNLYLVTPRKYQSVSLTSFDSQSFIPKKDTVTTIKSYIPEPVKVETVYVASVAPEIKPEISPEKVQKTGSDLPISSGASQSLAGHHVISGVFKIRENAEAKLSELLRRGFSSAKIIVANGRNYVTFGSFSTHADAALMADSLRSDSAWIWKN